MKKWQIRKIRAAAAVHLSTGWPLGLGILSVCTVVQGLGFAGQLAQQRHRMAQWNTLPDGFAYCLAQMEAERTFWCGLGVLAAFLLLRNLWPGVGSGGQRQFWGRLPLSPLERAAAMVWANFAWFLAFWGLQLGEILAGWLVYSRQFPLRQYSELDWAFLRVPLLRRWFPLLRPVQLVGILLLLFALSILCAGLGRGTRGRLSPLDPLDISCLVAWIALAWLLARMPSWETAFLWAAAAALVLLAAGMGVALCLCLERPMGEEG